MKISLIAAMAKNRIIGQNGKMPWHIPAELKHFKQLTMGKPIIMGRNTFESIGKPLPGRRNLVVSRSWAMSGDGPAGVEIFGGLEAALQAASTAMIDEVMVIGGGTIYAEAILRADAIYLTVIQKDFDGDVSFPEIPRAFELASETSVPDSEPPLHYQVWKRKIT